MHRFFISWVYANVCLYKSTSTLILPRFFIFESPRLTWYDHDHTEVHGHDHDHAMSVEVTKNKNYHIGTQGVQSQKTWKMLTLIEMKRTVVSLNTLRILSLNTVQLNQSLRWYYFVLSSFRWTCVLNASLQTERHLDNFKYPTLTVILLRVRGKISIIAIAQTRSYLRFTDLKNYVENINKTSQVWDRIYA